jgi:O-antigen/teichoic acid export membrane protein
MAAEAERPRRHLRNLWNAVRPASNRRLFRIARNASWLTMSRLLGDVLSFLVFIAIARFYGPAGTGSYSFGFAIAGFIATITNPALGDYGIREYARASAAGGTALFQTILRIQALLLLLSLLALATAIIVLRPSAEAAGLIVFLSIHMASLALARTLFIPAYADEAMAFPAILELSCRLGAIATALVLMASTTVPLLNALIGFPIFGLAAALGAAASAKARVRTFRANTTRKALSATMRQIWPFAASELVGQLYMRTEIILLGLLVGDVATGIYASGLKFLEVGFSPLAFLGFAIFPSLSRISVGNRTDFERAATMFLRIALALGGCLTLLLCFVVPPLLVPVLGVRFAEAAAMLPWMSSLATLQAVVLVMTHLLLVCDLQVRCFKLVMLSTITRLAVALLLISRFHVAGAVTAAISGVAVLGLLSTLAVRGHLAVGEHVRIIGGFVTVLSAAVGIGMAVGLISPLLAPGAVFVSFGLAVFLFRLLPLEPIPTQPLSGPTLD